MTDHRLERIDFKRPSRFVAVCACGWRSEPTLSAGLAGALWDRHVAERRSDDGEGRGVAARPFLATRPSSGALIPK